MADALTSVDVFDDTIGTIEGPDDTAEMGTTDRPARPGRRGAACGCKGGSPLRPKTLVTAGLGALLILGLVKLAR